jgi:hypothetical protein
VRFLHITPLLALAVLLHASAAAQTRPAKSVSVDADAPAAQAGTRFWAGLGAGAGTSGLAGQADASLLVGPHLFRLRYTVHSPVGTAGAGDPVPMEEASVMYGRGTWIPNGSWISGAVGVGIVTGRSEPEAFRNFDVLGLAAEAQVLFRRLPFVSLTGIANLNPEQPMAGITVGIVLGSHP